MVKTVLLPLLAVIIFIAAVGYLSQQNKEGKIIMTPSETKTQTEISINDIKINAQVADEEGERKVGLSKHNSLEENEGMLFIFDQKDVIRYFWMKDMKIAIDIIWIDDNRIVDIDKNVQPPEEGTPDEKLKLYNPKRTIDYVLEVNGGYTDKNNIKVGDEIKGL